MTRVAAAAGSSHHLTGLDVAALIVGGFLALLGIRSFVAWFRAQFRPASAGESVLYAIHVTARVGMWFAFAGFFVGYAIVDEPQRFRWFVMVPLALVWGFFVVADSAQFSALVTEVTPQHAVGTALTIPSAGTVQSSGRSRRFGGQPQGRGGSNTRRTDPTGTWR